MTAVQPTGAGPAVSPAQAEALAWLRGETSLAALRGYTEAELEALADLGYALFRQGQDEPARVVFEGLASLSGREYPLRALGAIAVAGRRYDDAVAVLGAAITRHPAGLASRVLRAEALTALGRYAEARADLDWVVGAVARDPEERALQRRAGVMRRRAVRPGAAR
ncbi:MAG TPA: tetratricopeptide repeat protein [Polyangia bacterium]